MALDRLMADGVERSVDEIIDAIGWLVPAGAAVRWARQSREAERVARWREGRPSSGRIHRPDVEEDLRIGVRHFVRSAIRSAEIQDEIGRSRPGVFSARGVHG